jgi:hypothetical protein
MLNEISQRRVRYIKAGYEPLPCIGKRPAPAGWSKMQIDLDAPVAWGAVYPNATNTGIRTQRAPAVDIDVYDAAMADRVEAVLQSAVSAPLRKRIGMPPKRLIPFRCDTPFSKIIAKFKSPNDDKIHTVEVLGDGQQYIAEGIHPDTGLPYTWEGGDLLDVDRGQLPLLDEDTAREFIARVRAIMLGAGWAEADGGGKAKTNGAGKSGNGTEGTLSAEPIYYRAALRDECDALATMPKNSGRNHALNRAAFNLFQLVAIGGLDENVVRERLFAAAEACGLVADDGAYSVWATLESGAKAGRQHPRQTWHESVEEGAEENADEDQLEIVAAADLEMSAIEWLWPGRFALGKIGLVAGLPDYGKGQIAAFLAAAVTVENVELPCEEGRASQGHVIWFNAEDDARDTVLPRLVAAGADPKRVHFVNSAKIGGNDKHFSLVTDLPLLRKAIKRIGNVVLVIIDPISAYLGLAKWTDARQPMCGASSRRSSRWRKKPILQWSGSPTSTRRTTSNRPCCACPTASLMWPQLGTSTPCSTTRKTRTASYSSRQRITWRTIPKPCAMVSASKPSATTPSSARISMHRTSYGTASTSR